MQEKEDASCRCITPAVLEESSLSLETCSRAPISSHKARAEKCLHNSHKERSVGVCVGVRSVGCGVGVKMWGVMVCG